MYKYYYYYYYRYVSIIYVCNVCVHFLVLGVNL